MAKIEQITLQDIIKSQEANKTGGMSSFVLDQLSAIEKAEKESIKIEETSSNLTGQSIVELQGINQATHDTVNNLVKLTQAVNDNTKILSSPIKANDLSEADIENKKIQDEQTALLNQIAENTTPKPPVPPESNLPDFGGLGGLMTGVAIVIGTFIGVIRAQVKAIKLFSEALGVDKLISAVKGGLLKVGEFFGGLVNIAKDRIGMALEGVVKFFTGTFDKIKGAFKTFSSGEAGAVFDAIEEGFKAVVSKLKAIKDGVMKFVMPFINAFTDAFKIIGEMFAGPVGKAVEGIKGTFSAIGQYFGTFAKSIGKVAGIVGKLFLPITIIMTLWDTVKGAMEGFAKDGIIGGIKGAITGLVNSLIMGPLDMVKNAIAWILGMFGFDKAKALLKSFSLEDIFKKFVDAIFSPIEMIKDMFNAVIDFFKGIEIPAIGFEVFGKKFGAGPWHPFADDEKSKGSSAPEAGGKAPMTNVTTSQSYETVAGIPVVKGKPLTQQQVAVTDMAIASGNTPSPLVKESYDLAKAQVQPEQIAVAPNTAASVYNQSGKNAEAKSESKPAPSAPIVVSAPTTVNKTNQQGFFKSPIRNPEHSVNQFYKSRFA
jgi:hypothetical protein